MCFANADFIYDLRCELRYGVTRDVKATMRSYIYVKVATYVMLHCATLCDVDPTPMRRDLHLTDEIEAIGFGQGFQVVPTQHVTEEQVVLLVLGLLEYFG